jgi:hypothetical protein
MAATQPARSWVPGADASGFGIRNLPWGVALSAIGDQVRQRFLGGKEMIDGGGPG